MAQADAVVEEVYEPHPRRWRIFVVSLAVGFMSLLDVTIVNVAVPSMQQGLHTTTSGIQWVVSGYALAFGLTLVTGGRLGDVYGRRRMMLIGLTGFIAASAAIGLSSTIAEVVVARFVQGLLAGMLTPQNSGLIQQLFRGVERARAFSYFGTVVAVSSASGPVIGGAIIALAGSASGWRYLFLVNVPIGLVTLVLVARLVPGPPRRSGAADLRLDVVGSLLLGATVLCLLLPIVSIEGGSDGMAVLLAGVALFGWAFVAWERRVVARGRPPLLDVSLLRRLPGYANGMAVGAAYFMGFSGLPLVMSLYWQTSLGFSAFVAGMLMAPYAVGSAIFARRAGRLVVRYGRRLTVAGLSVVILGYAALAILVPDMPRGEVWTISVPVLFVAGVGGSGVVTPNLVLTLADVPPRMGGVAGGAIQTGQRIGSSVGAAVALTAYQAIDRRSTDGNAMRYAVLVAVVMIGIALVLAIRDAVRMSATEAPA